MTLQRDPRVAALLPEAQATINRVARSFALAARFLPREVRDDINLLYLALRRLDDLVDLEAPSGSAQRADAQQRQIEEVDVVANLARQEACRKGEAARDTIDGCLCLGKECRHARIALEGHAVTGGRDFRSGRWRARRMGQGSPHESDLGSPVR